jgi:26S proteasome regulatory subunit T3
LVSYGVQDIGGCDIQKQEIREAVELPLTHHELYKQIGIDPPRGVLLYGPPGTGKTMLAKAVAHHTTAAFIRVVGSEFVQKYLGEVSWELLSPNMTPFELDIKCSELMHVIRLMG